MLESSAGRVGNALKKLCCYSRKRQQRPWRSFVSDV
jgi:hypothetical protein